MTAVLATGACATTSAGEPVVTPEPQNERTELTGTAQDAKSGAVIVARDGRVVYVAGLDAWPRGVAGRRVRADGRLVTAARLPRGTRDASGAWSQGVSEGSDGESWLDEPRWRIDDAVGAPWTVAIADGSGNLTTFTQAAEGAEVTWVYRPVTPAESSSGTYSGGSPAQGSLTAAQGEAFWTLVFTAEQAAAPGAKREMGTVQVGIRAADQEKTFIVSGGAGAVVDDWLKALRKR